MKTKKVRRMVAMPSLPRCTMTDEDVNAFYSNLDYQIARIANL